MGYDIGSNLIKKDQVKAQYPTWRKRLTIQTIKILYEK